MHDLTKSRQKLLIFLFTVMAAAILLTVLKPIQTRLSLAAAQKTIQTAVYISGAPDKNSSVAYQPSDGVTPDIEPDVQMLLNMDLGALQMQTPDISGWLYLPGTDLSLPVLSNNEYAVLDWTGERSLPGSLIFETRDYTACNLVLSGSSELMPQVSYFSDSAQNFAEYHQAIYLRTGEDVRTYHIFSAYRTDDILTALQQPDDDQYASWMDLCYEKTSVRVPPGPGSAIQVLTLITPDRDGFSVVHFGLGDVIPVTQNGAA